jgi:hypothetical protein
MEYNFPFTFKRTLTPLFFNIQQDNKNPNVLFKISDLTLIIGFMPININLRPCKPPLIA